MINTADFLSLISTNYHNTYYLVKQLLLVGNLAVPWRGEAISFEPTEEPTATLEE